MLSFLRETNVDGSPGMLSSRRIAAFILIFFSAPLFFTAFKYSENGWAVFIPGGLSIILATILFLFTTMTDLKAIVEAAAALKKGG